MGNESIKLYNDDCLNILPTIPDNSIDCIITDPPYKISVEGNKIVRNIKHYKWKCRNDISFDFGEWDRQWDTDEEYFIWVEKWFKQLARILKEKSWIYIFFDKLKIGFFDLYLAKKYGIKSRNIYTWVKTNPVPSFRKVNYNSGTEFIWVGSKGDCKLKNFKQQKYMSNYFISSNSSNYKQTEHPTEKPVNLLKHLIEVNSNEGEIILDCFMGSGSTGVACKQLNRKFIGIEKEKKYFDIAKKRIDDIMFQQLTLNND